MKTLATILVSTLGALAMFDATRADDDIGCNEYGKSGFIYIIREDQGEYYKIGGASDLGQRLSNLQTGNPRRLNFERVYVAGDCKHAENLAANRVENYSANLGGGTEWFHVEANNLGDFLQSVHDAILDQHNDFQAYQYWP